MKTLLTAGFCLLLFSGFCQTSDPSKPSKEIRTEENLEGTYQIIYLTKVEELFTVEYMQTLIAANRHPTQTVDVNVSQYTIIRILPYAIIDDPKFLPLTTTVIRAYENK